MPVTRLGLYGGPRPPYASFAGKSQFQPATLNAVEVFPTGSSVTITVYNLTTGATETLTSNVVNELGTTGLFIWNTSKITTQPALYTEYGYIMTDGTTPKGGVIYAPAPINLFVAHESIFL